MGEENVDNAIAPDGIVPESGDLKKDTGLLVEEASDDNNEQGAVDSDVATSESTDSLADKTTDAVQEEGEDLGLNNQNPDGLVGQISPSRVTDSAGPSKTKSVVGLDHKFTVRSRYRRASIGSCHDLCKGHNHVPEKVTKRPFLGTIKEGRKLVRTASGDNLAKPVRAVLEKETKSKPLRRLSLPGPTPVKDPPAYTKGTESPKMATPTRSKAKAVQGVMKPPSVLTPEGSLSRTKVDIPAVKKAPKERSSQKLKENITKEGGSSNESRKVKAKEAAMNSASISLKKSPSIRARLYKNLRSFSRSRHQSTSDDVKIMESHEVPEKADHMTEPNTNITPTEKALKSSLSSEELPSTPKGSRAVKVKKSDVNNKGTRFGLSSFSSASTSKSSASTARRTARQEEYQQKSNSVNTKQIGTVTEEGGSKTSTPRAKATANPKTKAIKKTGLSRPEEKESSSWKVKFRRGTVVNLQAASNSPRKLRFKRGRIVGEDQNAEAEDKSLKSTDDRPNESPDKPEPEKVHLRRQEGSGKKDSVDLNNVIEETASKLVKTRKSKVKALVGAFESVMSFRDRKPLVETSAS